MKSENYNVASKISAVIKISGMPEEATKTNGIETMIRDTMEEKYL